MSQKKTMTVTLLKRFEEMVDAAFDTVQAEASALDAVQKMKVEVAVKKELGIYDLYQQLMRHETAVKEIKSKLSEWESQRHIGGCWQTKISHLVNTRLGGDDALPSTQIKKAKQQVKDKMLFCTMPDEIRVILETLPGLVADITKQLPKASKKELIEAQAEEIE
jgi:hypothetical protein